MQVTGLILAGGLSSRFGSDKSQALYCGRSFIRTAYELLKPVCYKVIISGTDKKIDVNGIISLPDITPGGGPMSGIATAVKRLKSQWLLIVPCDMPLLTPDIISATLQEAKSGQTVVWKEPDGRIQPFPMLLNRHDAEEAIRSLGESAGLSIKLLLRTIPHTMLDISDDQRILFSNINTQAEFEKLCLSHQ